MLEGRATDGLGLREKDWQAGFLRRAAQVYPPIDQWFTVNVDERRTQIFRVQPKKLSYSPLPLSHKANRGKLGKASLDFE